MENNPDAERRSALAKEAKIRLLDEFTEISFVVEYAKIFGMDPDVVYLKEFNTVLFIMKYEKRLNEYKERFSILNRESNASS